MEESKQNKLRLEDFKALFGATFPNGFSSLAADDANNYARYFLGFFTSYNFTGEVEVLVYIVEQIDKNSNVNAFGKYQWYLSHRVLDDCKARALQVLIERFAPEEIELSMDVESRNGVAPLEVLFRALRSSPKLHRIGLSFDIIGDLEISDLAIQELMISLTDLKPHLTALELEWPSRSYQGELELSSQLHQLLSHSGLTRLKVPLKLIRVRPLFEALKVNTSLLTLDLRLDTSGFSSDQHACRIFTEDMRLLVSVLEDHNTTFIKVKASDRFGRMTFGLINRRVRYLGTLNEFGRQQAQRNDTSAGDWVHLLTNVLEREECTNFSSLAIAHGLLRENPNSWSAKVLLATASRSPGEEYSREHPQSAM